MRWGTAIVLGALTALGSCKRKHVAVETLPELAYPACTVDAGAPAIVGKGRLRPGSTMLDNKVVESFELTKDACHYVFRGREEWPLFAADVEVVYDDTLTPLRVWKRMTVPGSPRPDGHADIRRYELRTPEVTIKRRTPEGEVKLEMLRPGGKDPPPAGNKPVAVIGPGRGILTVWIKRAKLAPGEKVRELVLDFREMIELLQNVTLKREDDQYEASLGRTVRVYTIYGREAVFTDENDVVLGDLQGMRPSDTVKTPEPPPMPRYGEPDPVGTP